MPGTYGGLPSNMVDVMAEKQKKLPFIEPMALELLRHGGSIEAAIDEVARDEAWGDLKVLVRWAAKDDNVFYVEELYGDETNPFDTLKDLFKEARYDFNVELLKEAFNEGELSEYLAFRSLARQGFAVVSEEVAKDVCVNAIDVLHTDSFEEFDRIASEAIASAKARECREGASREAYTFEEARRAFATEYKPGDVVRKATSGSVSVVLGYDEGLGRIVVSKENGDLETYSPEECVRVPKELVPQEMRWRAERLASANKAVPERGAANATPEQDERTARSQAALAPAKENPKPNRMR